MKNESKSDFEMREKRMARGDDLIKRLTMLLFSSRRALQKSALVALCHILLKDIDTFTLQESQR